MQLILVQVELLEEGVFEEIVRETLQTLTAKIDGVKFALGFRRQLYFSPSIFVLFFLRSSSRGQGLPAGDMCISGVVMRLVRSSGFLSQGLLLCPELARRFAECAVAAQWGAGLQVTWGEVGGRR